MYNRPCHAFYYTCLIFSETSYNAGERILPFHLSDREVSWCISKIFSDLFIFLLQKSFFENLQWKNPSLKQMFCYQYILRHLTCFLFFSIDKVYFISL